VSDACPSRVELESIAEGRAASTHDEHLASCGACRELLQEIRRTNELLREYSLRPGLAAAGPRFEVSIPGYDLQREIFRGAQGVVYEARRAASGQRVAIKVMRQGPYADLGQRARFEGEAETLRGIRHPNIVTVFETGVAGGFHYFVMEYVDEFLGAERTRRAGDADATPTRPIVSISARLRMFLQICEAVHAAHLAGVIHRDLKPANILVVESGSADSSRAVKILDFGLAKSLRVADESLAAPAGQFVGSLPWASPEQAEARVPIDVRSDVYSLGVILYQMLTGRLPYDVGTDLRTALERIATAEPPLPSVALYGAAERPRVENDLDTIVLRCLAKDRERRYQSAGDLARDLRHHLAGDPIEARRDSAVYLLRQSLQRYRRRLVLIAGLVVLLAGVSVISTLLFRQSQASERKASLLATSLSRALSRSRLEQGIQAAALDDLGLAERLLWRELLEEPGSAELRLTSPPGPSAVQWALRETYRRHPSPYAVHIAGPGSASFCVTDAGRAIWTADASGLLSRYEPARAEIVESFSLAGATQVWLVDGLALFRPAGADWIAGCRLAERAAAGIRIPTTAAWAAARDGRRIATLDEGRIAVWDARSGAKIQSFDAPDHPVALTLSRDGARMAAYMGGVVQIWDVDRGAPLSQLPKPGAPAVYREWGGIMAFTDDGTRLAEAPTDMPLCIWDIGGEQPELLFRLALPERPRSLQYSSSGRYLGVSREDGVIQIADAHSGEWQRQFSGHSVAHGQVEFSTPQGLLWSSGADNRVRAWEIFPRAVTSIEIPGEQLHAVDYSPDGRFYAAGGLLGAVYVGAVGATEPPRVVFEHKGLVSCVRFSPSGTRLATGSYDGTAALIDLRAGGNVSSLPAHPNYVSWVSFDPAETRVATSCDDSVVRVWSLKDHALVLAFEGPKTRIPHHAFDVEGRELAMACLDGTCRVWDCATKNSRVLRIADAGVIRAVEYSPDGRMLATAGADRSVSVWDARTLQLVTALPGHTREIYSVAWSPHGDMLASGDRSGQIRLWDVSAAECIAVLPAFESGVAALGFSPDGRHLAAVGLRTSIKFWDLAYHDRHIAGNLDAQLRDRNADALDPRGSRAWRNWAADVLNEARATYGDGPAASTPMRQD
jgi:eukaryotic-like serine/threonine-protein kinase